MERVAQLRTPREMIETILSGKFERAGDFRGHTIPIMPAWARLANEDIAAVLNYIQATWGDGRVQVTPEDVAMLRGEVVDTPTADPTSPALARAKEIYFDRCVGCHSVGREGASGAALLPWSMRLAGTERNKMMIHYGSSYGMPGFGVDDELSAEEMQALAEYLKQDVPNPPPFTAEAIRESRTSSHKSGIQPKPQFAVEDLVVTLRHDVGGVLIFDANTRTIVSEVDTDVAPHDVAVSNDQRYLYVLSRGGRVTQIDLAASPPERVADVRIGYEARSLTTTRLGTTGVVAVSTFHPGHVVMLHGETLELLTVLDPRPPGTTNGKFRLSQIVATPQADALIVAAKDQGFLHRIDTDNPQPNLRSKATRKFLRSGSFDPSGRYFVIPSDDEEVVIYDVTADAIVDTVYVPGLNGSSKGMFYEDAKAGPIWVASAMADDKLTFLSAKLPPTPASWRILHSMQTPGAGSLYVAQHPASEHLWFDIPLNSDPAVSGAVYAVDRSNLEQGYRTVQITEALGAEYADGRVLHPQFNKAGDELWVTVWNRQDKSSAIVIIDDRTLEVRDVIRDTRLITPIRSYALWQHTKQ
jgi:nitrite reductase (NO-forming)/hydroxylamine reductase